MIYPGEEGTGNDGGVEEIWTENGEYMEENLSGIWGGKAVKIKFSRNTFLCCCFLKLTTYDLVNKCSVAMTIIEGKMQGL